MLTTFGYNLWYQTCIAFSEVALLTEVNSVFLHARKLMQMFRVPFSHWLYRIIVVINLVTFVVFRGLGLSLIVVGVIKYKHKISTYYVFGLASSMTIMIAINPVLFWRLLKSDVLRAFNKHARKSPQKEAGKDKRDLTAVNGVNAHAMLNDHVRMTSQNEGFRKRDKTA